MEQFFHTAIYELRAEDFQVFPFPELMYFKIISYGRIKP